MGRGGRGPAARVRRVPHGRGHHRPAPGDHPPRPGRIGRRPHGPPGRPRPPPRRGRPGPRQNGPALAADLLKRVTPETAGCPVTGERWVRTSLRGLAKALDGRACPTTIGRLLRANGLGLRGHRTRLSRTTHADRDTQFESSTRQRRAFARAGNPRISIDANKRENVGAFENPGRRWCRAPTDVNTHDFPTDPVAQAVPYGVYDPGLNRGHVCVGTSGNTPDLAADAVRDWWRQKGTRSDPGATGVMIEADGGGSNGSTSRRFEFRLQEFADETGLAVTVCHDPPGASKWNPIEHQLFSQISATWAGLALSTVAVLVGLIRRTTTATGLRVTARVMPKKYPTGLKVTAAEFRAIRLTRPKTCPQWNYTIRPRTGGKNTE